VNSGTVLLRREYKTNAATAAPPRLAQQLIVLRPGLICVVLSLELLIVLLINANSLAESAAFI
jgi:hypothetical protein